MKALRSLLIVSLFALASTASAQTRKDEVVQQIQAAPEWKFEFHGFVSGSMYYQDQAFAGGQGQALGIRAPTPVNEAGGSNSTLKSGNFVGGDTRQTRWLFIMTGPLKVFDATAKAVMEVDFGGAPGTGGGGPQGWGPRTREFYSELNWGNTQLSVGQRNDLLLINGVETLAHIGSPYAFYAGFIGFRQPGVRVTYGIPMDAMKLTLAAEAMANKWASPGAAATPNLWAAGNTKGPDARNPAEVDLGEASGLPMFLARAVLEGKAGPVTYNVNLTGEYHSVNLKGFGDSNINGGAPGVVLADGTRKESLSGTIIQAGGRFTVNVGVPIHLRLNFYTGNATANRVGGSMGNFGDIKDTSYMGQLGVNLTPEFSLWGWYGHQGIDKDQARNWVPAAPIAVENNAYSGMARYSVNGYAFGLEYIHFETTFLTGTFAAPGPDQKTNATQIIATANYYF